MTQKKNQTRISPASVYWRICLKFAVKVDLKTLLEWSFMQNSNLLVKKKPKLKVSAKPKKNWHTKKESNSNISGVYWRICLKFAVKVDLKALFKWSFMQNSNLLVKKRRKTWKTRSVTLVQPEHFCEHWTLL